MKSIYQEWLEAKAAESRARAERQEIEDSLIEAWGVPATETGVKSFEEDGYKVKVTFRQNQTVDVAGLKELAIEAGLVEHLDALFRWKAEINKKNWKAAAATITGPLAGAITTKPGRPSFAVEAKEPREGEENNK